MSISRMIAQGIPTDVIQTVTSRKNPNLSARYDRTSLVRHVVAQCMSQGEGEPNFQYSDFIARKMEYWKKRNISDIKALSSRLSPEEIRGSLSSDFFGFPS